jgi:FimV-like protein
MAPAAPGKSTLSPYYVKSKKGDAYDGDVFIRVGDERGCPKGEEPAAKPKPEDKPKEDKPKEEKPKDKPKEKPKVEDKPKEDKPAEDDPEKVEKDAGRKLKLAKMLIDDGLAEQAREPLEEIVKKFPNTKAADEARQLLKKLDM